MRLAFCILLILPIFHFALAAPVAVGEMLEVRSNVMAVRKDDMAAWKKRMDDDDDDYAASATGDYDRDDDAPDDGDNNEYNEEDMYGSESSLHSGEIDSDARGPDANYNVGPQDSDSDSDKGEGGGGGSGTVAAKSDSDSDKEVNPNGGGYEADNDDDHANDNDHSGHDSSFAGLDPATGPGVTGPATPERTPDLEKMISALTNILTFGSRVTPAG